MVRGVTAVMTELMTADAVEGRIGALQVHRKGFVDSIDAVPTKLNMPYSDEMRARIAKVPHVTAVTGRIQFNDGPAYEARLALQRKVDAAFFTEPTEQEFLVSVTGSGDGQAIGQ